MIRTAVYMRVSSDKQAQEGDSIPAQRNALKKYIDDRDDLILAGEYLDDGISGTKADRDELSHLLDDVKGGRIDLIIFTKLDRWFRSVRHYTTTQALLDKYKVDWKAIWEPIYDTTTPQGRLIINQMMSIAQFEAENTGQRIRQVQKYKVSQGEVISGSTPPGYTIVEKHLIPDELAPTVAAAFQYYDLCGSIRKTMARFDGLPRTQPAFKNMLMNEKYIGRMRDNSNFCPPIVSRELFDSVQRKLSINVKSSQKWTYIFSGLIKCGECGRSMGGNRRKRVRKSHTYIEYQYRCPGHFVGGVKRCDNCKVICESQLEKHLLDTIRPQIQGIILEYEVEQAQPKDNKAQVQSVRAKMDRLKELYINGLIDLDEYKVEKEKYDDLIRELEKETAPPNLDALKDMLKTNIEELYMDMTKEEKRYFWRSIIKEIRMGVDRVYHVDFLL